eukprot:3596442-Rhodomonas_salina.1
MQPGEIAAGGDRDGDAGGRMLGDLEVDADSLDADAVVSGEVDARRTDQRLGEEERREPERSRRA